MADEEVAHILANVPDSLIGVGILVVVGIVLFVWWLCRLD